MNKLKGFVLILVLVPTLFADDLFQKPKWQISNEYTQKSNILFSDNSYDYSDNHQSKFPTYAKEFGFALAASAGCLVGGGCLASTVMLMSSEGGFFGEPSADGNLWGAIIVVTTIVIGMPLSAAYGTINTPVEVSEIPSSENFRSSYVGAFCGLLIGGGIGSVTFFIIHNDWAVLTTAIAAIVGNSLGAVIGHNLSLREGEGGYGFLHRHFDLPGFSMKTKKTQQGKSITALDFRLINARF